MNKTANEVNTARFCGVYMQCASLSHKLINFVRCIQLAKVRGVVVVMESRKGNLTKVEHRTETVRRTLDSLLLLCLSVCLSVCLPPSCFPPLSLFVYVSPFFIRTCTR